MNRTDRISSFIILAVSVFFLINSQGLSSLDGLFPRVVISILGGLSLILFVRSFFRRMYRSDASESSPASSSRITVLICWMLMTAWVLLIPVLGFLVTSLIFFPLTTVYLDRKADRRKKAQRIAIGLGATLVFYWFFSRVLFVHFPEGMLI